MTWLIETMIWTGFLILLVLLLRRPVARHFGPQAAYALWLLPMLRLVMPPLTLPAWMNVAPRASEPLVAAEGVATAELLLVEAAVPATQAAVASSPVDWTAVVVSLWAAGAIVFLVLRFGAYFRLRRELLEDAWPVGNVGKVRLVESGATRGPLAFGVVDRVVVLPPGFMAMRDRQKRDLALAHELAHHQGRDLLVNMLVQPLFALHWFNPLGWAGWTALRRDQEAACDARVVSSRSACERAHYAAVVADFATGARVSLAAPMACPVLGEKSIIHRLRSLTMSDVSPRKRATGRLLIIGGAVALPLTATVSYAELPAPPAPPAAPVAPVAPKAPPPPKAPAPAPAPQAPMLNLQAAAGQEIEKHVTHEDHDEHKRHIEKRFIKSHAGSHVEGWSEKDKEEMRRELREAFADMEEARAEAKNVRRMSLVHEAKDGDKTKVAVACSGGSDAAGRSAEEMKADALTCQTKVMARALEGLKEARKSIAGNEKMSADIRAQVVAALDEKIANWPN